MFTLWERWGPALGIVAVIAWAIAFVVANGSPDTDSSNAKIVSYYASNSHQHTQFIGFFLFLAGTLCVIGFFAALRQRLAQAEHTEMGVLAYGAGIASALAAMLGIAMFTAPAFVASDTSAADVVPSTFRMLNDMGYQYWVIGATIGAIVVWATSAVAIRTGVLPRWFGWVGVIVGVIQLVAILFFPILLWWVWILVAAALLTWRRDAITARPVPASST